MAERSGYARTVLVGLSGAVLAAVAASRVWARASGSAAGVDVSASSSGSSSAPLAVALALVALAAWGVVLVLRGRPRRAIAVVGVLAAAGTLVSGLVSAGRARDDAVAAAVARGGTGDAFTSSLTGWYYVCLVTAAVTLAAFVVAVVAAPRWPAMSSRYDAPATRAPAEPVSEQDMWRALDDGRDPTA